MRRSGRPLVCRRGAPAVAPPEARSLEGLRVLDLEECVELFGPSPVEPGQGGEFLGIRPDGLEGELGLQGDADPDGSVLGWRRHAPHAASPGGTTAVPGPAGCWGVVHRGLESWQAHAEEVCIPRCFTRSGVSNVKPTNYSSIPQVLKTFENGRDGDPSVSKQSTRWAVRESCGEVHSTMS